MRPCISKQRLADVLLSIVCNRFDQALRPREVQPAQNRFVTVLEGAYLYPEKQAEFRKKSYDLAMQKRS